MDPITVLIGGVVVIAVTIVVANNYFHKQYAAVVAEVEARLAATIKGTASVTQATVLNAVKAIPAPVITTTPGVPGQIGDSPSTAAINAAAQAKIAAWLAPAIDWTKVTASDLMALMAQMTASTGTTTMDYVTGAVATIPPGGIANPNFAAQGAFLRGEPTTESQRAYVGANNQDGIWAHFRVGPDGTLVAM